MRCNYIQVALLTSMIVHALTLCQTLPRHNRTGLSSTGQTWHNNQRPPPEQGDTWCQQNELRKCQCRYDLAFKVLVYNIDKLIV